MNPRDENQFDALQALERIRDTVRLSRSDALRIRQILFHLARAAYQRGYAASERAGEAVVE